MRIERGFRDSGRDAALDALVQGGALLVLGPAGSGRTVLLAELADVEERRRRVWWCRGHVEAEPSAEPLLVSGEVESLLGELAVRPTTVLVDDAHLLDDSLLRRLVLLAERRRELALQIVAARRPVRAGPTLARLDAALLGGRGALHLGPLTAAGLAQWLVAERGADDGAPDVLARTGGWPELVAAETSGPRVVADLAAARLAQLGAAHQRVLRAMSFGLPVGARALGAATAASGDEVDDAVDAALAVGLVHEGSAPVPAIAEALREQTPAADRARIAAAAVASGPVELVVAVAHHLAARGDWSDEAGVAYEVAAHAVRGDLAASGRRAVRGRRPLRPGQRADDGAEGSCRVGGRSTRGRARAGGIGRRCRRGER